MSFKQNSLKKRPKEIQNSVLEKGKINHLIQRERSLDQDLNQVLGQDHHPNIEILRNFIRRTKAEDHNLSQSNEKKQNKKAGKH